MSYEILPSTYFLPGCKYHNYETSYMNMSQPHALPMLQELPIVMPSFSNMSNQDHPNEQVPSKRISRIILSL